MIDQSFIGYSFIWEGKYSTIEGTIISKEEFERYKGIHALGGYVYCYIHYQSAGQDTYSWFSDSAIPDLTIIPPWEETLFCRMQDIYQNLID